MQCKVNKIGFCIHNKYCFLGASPDGIFEYNKNKYLLEIKWVAKNKYRDKTIKLCA